MLKSNSFLVYLYDKDGNEISEIKSKNIIQYKFNIHGKQTFLNLAISILGKLIRTYVFQKIQFCTIEFYDDSGNVVDNETYYVNELTCEATGSLVDQQDKFFAYNLRLNIVEKDLIEDNNNNNKQTENEIEYEQ